MITIGVAPTFLGDSKQEADMASSFKQRTLDGFEDDDDAFDENGILRDGHRARYPMTMMDSGFDDTQRAVARDAHERRVATRFGLSDGSALHRPGFRHNVNDIGLDARIEAHELYRDETENAWRSPATRAGSSSARGAKPGDSCTLNGRVGRLRSIGGSLVCVPDNGQYRGNDSVMSDRELAHLEYQTRVENAWRNPDADVSDRSVQSNDGMTMDEIYAEYDRELAASYRKVKP
jgi:hypothetical protein